MRLNIAASTAVALLVATGASTGWAQKGKKKDSAEVPASINKQFQWEDKVVGPKAGIDKDKIAAIQEQGRREDQARKKEPPKKQGRAQGVGAPATASLPTMDIEKPAAPSKKSKKVASSDGPRHRDALDNLLDEQGVKPDNPSGGGTGDSGLGSVLASDDKPTGSSGGASSSKKSKKTRRR
jgi:hypothetical protein